MPRRPIKDALKVLIGVVLVGPPVGGILFIALTQIVPWIATGFPGGTAAAGHIAYMLAAIIPLSYVLGGHTAVLAGLALAAYAAWGGRITVWTAMLAALIYPALVAATIFLGTTDTDAEVSSVVFGFSGLLAAFALAAAVVSYLILRRTWFMRDVTRTQAPRDGTP